MQRRTLIVFVLILAVLAGEAAAAPSGHHDQPHGQVETCTTIHVFGDGQYLQLCPPVGPTPTATPGASPTPGPSSTPEPAPTQPGTAPYASAPLCGGHDPRAYHSLWNSFEGCHFNHHHGDDPHLVDDLLGTEIYALMGGEISYPWQTFSASGQENDLKHAGYFWHVRRDMACDTTAPCITAFRALVHQHPSGRDATVRYHSYVFEAATSDGGYLLFGGWADFGDLHSPEGTIVINEPDNHDSRACTGAGRHKQHSPAGAPQIIWYGASQQTHGECGPRGFVTLSVSVHDVWDWTNPASPSDFTDYVCFGQPRCTANATLLRPHLIGINMVRRWDALLDPDGDGRANWTGWADRYGLLRSDGVCAEPGADCAPAVFRNLAVGQNYQAANAHTALSYREYDIYFGGQSSGWSRPVP